MNSFPVIFKSFCSSCDARISLQNVISVENRIRTVETLKSFKPFTNGNIKSKRRAAVLVPICHSSKGEPSLLFTVRAMKLRSNRGQVAFPGGMEDIDDKSLEATVLRETREEIGIESSNVDIWGVGPSVGRDDMMVTPFLAYVGEMGPKTLRINFEEESFLPQVS